MTPSDPSGQTAEHLDLSALYEATQLLSGSIDLSFVLNNLLLIAMSKLLVTRGVTLLFDPVRDEARVEAIKGISGIDKGEFISLDVDRGQEIVPVTAIPSTLSDHRIEFLMAIRYHDRLIGWLGLGPKISRQEFSDADIAFVRALVSISSAAVHNSLVIDELRTSNRDLDGKIQQLNTLFDLSQEFNSTRDRSRLVRLLSFALMGQLLVQRHLFLLQRPTGDEGASPPESGELLHVVAAQGVDKSLVEGDLLKRLSILDEAVYLDGSDSDWQRLNDLGIKIAIPLRFRGDTHGVLCLGPKMTGQPYEPADVEFLYALGNLALTSIQNTYLVDERVERERLAEEMRLAREIQVGLLPKSVPECDHADIATFATPSREVSGDYFDVVALPDGRLVFAIADVTGKGVPASLLMANLQACLKALLPMDLPLHDVTSRINDVIHENTGFDKFITFFWGVCGDDLKSFAYVNAGHNPPVLISTDGTLRHLEEGGLLLGIMSGVPYEMETVELSKGDVLAMFTDGVTEAMNEDGEEYDDARLEAILLKERAGSAQHILDAVLEDVESFSHGVPQSDDMTMIVVKAI